MGVLMALTPLSTACGSSDSVDDIKPNPKMITVKSPTPRDEAATHCELSEGLAEYSDAWENCIKETLAGR